jgi:hypothetical protein
MKPNFIPLIGALCMFQFAPAAFAERHTTPLPAAHMLQLLPQNADGPTVTFPIQRAATAAKTAGTGSRITGEYTATGTIAGVYRNKDSTHYTYSGIRGGDLNSNIYFDEERDYRWDTVANVWKPTYLYTVTYDPQNRPVTEIIQTWSTATNAFVNTNRINFSYDLQGNPILIKTEVWNLGTNTWNNYQQYTNFVYNSAGNPTSYEFQQWKISSSAWVNSQRYTGTYNSHGDETNWLTETWNTATAAWNNKVNEDYSYNAAFYPTRYGHESWDVLNARWRNDYNYVYYYNSSNHDIGYTRQIGDVIGTSWINADSFNYPSLNTMGSPLKEMGYTWNSNAWKPATRYTIGYSSANLETSSTREDWDGANYINKMRDFSTYNSFGQLLTSYGESFNNNLWKISTGDPNARYGYQNYATEVKPVVPFAELQLSPVPASDYVQIQMQWTSVQPFTIGIYDMTGRLIQQWSEGAMKDYSRQMPIAKLPSGVYMLRVSAEAGHLEKMFSVQQ